MTLPTSGPITIGMVAAELGLARPLALGDPRVRALAGVPSGPISLGQLRGRSATAPMTVTANNDYASANTQFGAGIVSCSPSVSITGGLDPKTCAWSVLSNPRGVAVTLSTGASVTVRTNYVKNATGFAEVSLRCTVTDGAGTQRTVDVTGTLEWNSNL